MNNKLNDQLIEEQQERYKFQNNTIVIDHQRDTLTVSLIIKCIQIKILNFMDYMTDTITFRF